MVVGCGRVQMRLMALSALSPELYLREFKRWLAAQWSRHSKHLLIIYQFVHDKPRLPAASTLVKLWLHTSSNSPDWVYLSRVSKQKPKLLLKQIFWRNPNNNGMFLRAFFFLFEYEQLESSCLSRKQWVLLYLGETMTSWSNNSP